jgi:hypothetical protein
MNVNVVSNPLKTFKVVHSLTYTASEKKTVFQFVVDLYPNYFDLTEGVWNVAISQYLVRNKNRTALNVLFNVSTNLIHHVVKDPYDKLSLPTSRHVVLTTILCSKTKGDSFDFTLLNPLFFQVESAPRSSFLLQYSMIPNLTVNNFDIDIELTFLFQRIK